MHWLIYYNALRSVHLIGSTSFQYRIFESLKDVSKFVKQTCVIFTFRCDNSEGSGRF